MSPVLSIERNVPIPALHFPSREMQLKSYRTRSKQGWKRRPDGVWRRGSRWITCEGCHENHFLYVEPLHPAKPRPAVVQWLGQIEFVYPAFTRPRSPYCPKCLRTYLRAEPGMRIDEMPLTPTHTGLEQRRTEATGEQRLAAGLIASAVYDLHRDNKYHGGRRNRDDVKRWLLGAPSTMSYQTCCDLLGLDPQWLRHAILHLPHNGNGHFATVDHRTTSPHPVEEYVPDAGGSLRSDPGRAA